MLLDSATAEDVAIFQRLMSSYDNYNAEIDTNLYKQFLFLTDPSHPAELNDRALLREALNEYNNWYFDWENNRKVQFDDPILRGNEISCADTYLAAMNGQYKIDWFNLMNAESGMLLAANMMTNAHYNAQSLINGANAKPSWLEADINPETWKGSYGGTGNKTNPNNVKVNQGQQDKHIPGTNNYKQGVESGANRGILKENPQQLLDERAGTGYKIPNTNRERIDFGRVIGQYYDQSTGKYVDTTNGMIHYDSKGGAHIVPSRPNGY